jgi:HSP20 family molecular chaperone IbpA
VPVDKTKAKASYNNGVLEISIPMAHKTSPGEIPVS